MKIFWRCLCILPLIFHNLSYAQPADSSWPMQGQNIYNTSVCTSLYSTSNTVKWKFKTENNIYSSPAIGPDGTVYVGSYDKYLYALQSDGTLKWKFLTGNSIHSSPAIDTDGTIYVGSWDNYLYAFSQSGILKWKFLTGGYVQSSQPHHSPAAQGQSWLYYDRGLCPSRSGRTSGYGLRNSS